MKEFMSNVLAIVVSVIILLGMGRVSRWTWRHIHMNTYMVTLACVDTDGVTHRTRLMIKAPSSGHAMDSTQARDAAKTMVREHGACHVIGMIDSN
jgi:hypothetical protein